MVWQRAAQGSAPRAIEAALVDGSAALASPVRELCAEGQTAGPFASANLGDLLAVAWRASIDSASTAIAVRVFHPDIDGATAEVLIGPELGAHATGEVSLIGSPDGQQLVLAWSEQPAGDALERIEVARLRLACGVNR